MRWTNKRPAPIGTSKVVKKFAFLPVTVGHTRVWLEFYYQHYIYEKHKGWKLRKKSHTGVN